MISQGFLGNLVRFSNNPPSCVRAYYEDHPRDEVERVLEVLRAERGATVSARLAHNLGGCMRSAPDFPRNLGKSGADLIQPPKICASLALKIGRAHV